MNFIKKEIIAKKTKLKNEQMKHEKNILLTYKEKKKIDDINSPNLIGYYKSSYKKIDDLYTNIQLVINQLEKVRGKTSNNSDIKRLQKRAENLYLKEYKELYSFEEH